MLRQKWRGVLGLILILASVGVPTGVLIHMYKDGWIAFLCVGATAAAALGSYFTITQALDDDDKGN